MEKGQRAHNSIIVVYVENLRDASHVGKNIVVRESDSLWSSGRSTGEHHRDIRVRIMGNIRKRSEEGGWKQSGKKSDDFVFGSDFSGQERWQINHFDIRCEFRNVEIDFLCKEVGRDDGF